MQSLASALLEIARRYPRDYEVPCSQLIQFLELASSSRSSAELRTLEHAWPAIAEQAVSRAHWASLLFPRQTASHPELLELLKKMSNRGYAPPGRNQEVEATCRAWIDEQASAFTEGALLHGLLQDLLQTDARKTPDYSFLASYYAFRDLLYGHLVNPQWQALQSRVFSILYEQRLRWSEFYCGGYAYQGWGRIGVGGVKPTEERLRRYLVGDLIHNKARVLDIGSNAGFVTLELAGISDHVAGIDLNPYMVAIANQVRDAIGIRNAEFAVADFVEFAVDDRYDVVLSFANHATIDGNLVMDFEEYVGKIFHLLRPQGILLFETHNVFGPGQGGAGDDGDFDRKMDIAARYFEVIKYKMTSAFVPAQDIDKLFVAMRRRSHVAEHAHRSFDLATARTRYQYSA